MDQRIDFFTHKWLTKIIRTKDKELLTLSLSLSLSL